MQQRILYNNTVITHQKKEYSFTNFTRNINLIPDEFFAQDMYNTVLVEDDLTFNLCSLSLYGKEEFWDMLMLYNNITNPLVLPKSSHTINDMVDVKLNNWIERYFLKGKDLDIPDISIKDNVWYIFQIDTNSTQDSNTKLLELVAKIQKEIDSLVISLSNLEAKYELIKDDSSDFGGYNRKHLRTDISETRDKIFKFQQDIMDIEEEGIDVKGTWVPIRQKDLDKLIDTNASKMIKQVYNKMLKDAIENNEKYRYIKYPKPEYLARILDYINKPTLK
jgi:hypothetical protein